MRTKIVLAGLLIGGVVTVAGSGLMANSPKVSANHPKQGKKQYVIRTSGRSFVDLSPAGSSPGDRVAFDNPLYDHTNTKELGSSRGECVQIGTSPTVYHCLAVFTLPGGQITTQGIADFAQTPATVAVTGGTGLYQQAQGQASFSEASPTTDQVVVELK